MYIQVYSYIEYNSNIIFYLIYIIFWNFQIFLKFRPCVFNYYWLITINSNTFIMLYFKILTFSYNPL